MSQICIIKNKINILKDKFNLMKKYLINEIIEDLPETQQETVKMWLKVNSVKSEKGCVIQTTGFTNVYL